MSGRKDEFPFVVFILVSIALAAGIIAAGTLYYRNYKQDYRLEVERRLSAISELKVGELAQWRKERLGDPETYLYPLLNLWPTPSRTAETLLVRRDGNYALFLNELKFQKKTALNLRIPLESKDTPAVKAALGQEGIVEGRDYRGVRVIADVRAVPDSPWFLVARMDASEAFGPMRERLREVIIMAALLPELERQFELLTARLREKKP